MPKNPIAIGVVGKGGSGKSVITALLLNRFVSLKKYKILAIDADPTRGLSRVLGIINSSKTLEDVRNEIISVGAQGDDDVKYELIETLPNKILETLNEEKGFSLVSMGEPIVKGCFCPANTVLKRAIEILLDKFDLIIIDCEAGLEQISRKVIEEINRLLIITDPSKRGFETAESIKLMSLKFTKSEKIGLIINRVKTINNQILQNASNINIEIYGILPEDDNITDFDIKGQSLLNLPKDSISLKEIDHIIKKLEIS